MTASSSTSGFKAGGIAASSEYPNTIIELLKKLVEIGAPASEKIKTPVDHQKKSSGSDSGPSYSSSSGSYSFATVDTALNKPFPRQKKRH